LAAKTVGDLGEFGLIERLRRRLGAPADDRLVVGIGDDAAVWRSQSGYTVATTDTMVAGVHFLPGVMPWDEVGWKALASNVSDIAAMGGTPSFALVTLSVSPATPVAAIDGIYRGIHELGSIYGVTVAGGDVVSAKQLSLTIAVLGEVSFDDEGRPKLLRRGAARPGDMIAVTGPLGGSAAGLRLLKRRSSAVKRTAVDATLIERHLHPWPRIDAGTAAVEAGVVCGMDISDGLVQDLGHVCKASGVDADIRLADVPIEDGLVDLFGEDDAAMMALTGGEDYELLLIGGERLQLARRALLEQLGVESFWTIGQMTAAGKGRVRVIGRNGRPIKIKTGGWDHLRKAQP
jgi:thiamine-monophosphate kinase